MIRGFEYKGIRFYLNDNTYQNEFEGKYSLMFWTGRFGWQVCATCNTKSEAKKIAKLKHLELSYNADYEEIAIKTTCNWGGICILECTDEYIVSAENNGNGLLRKAKAQIRYNTKGEAYFMRQGRREKLSEYLKVN